MDNYGNEMREGYEISLKDILKIFRKGLWIMLVTAVVFGVAAFGYSRIFIPKTYTTNVKLYVETSATTNANSPYSALSDYNLRTNLVNTYIQMLDTRNFRQKLSDGLDNKYTEAQLARMISFTSDADTVTEVFTATIKANTPTEAKVIGDSLAEVAPDIMSSLISDAELKIVDSATIPSAPSSPSVSRNTMLAFVAGFVLALIFVFVRELLDNKLKYDSDITELGGVPILSAVPDFGGDRIILGVNSDPTEASESEGA